ncbi:MAG: protein-S-isoprenylcysteine methyltransferase, partial [Pseudomonadota bacterium]|nr:protein-S-isoprenylcysteine methyltransferase [Pseudomonadota bacterium]
MFHDIALARSAHTTDPRPKSAVSTGCGLVGLAGLLCWVAAARWFHMDGPYAALVNVASCGVPMMVWAV